MIFRVSCLFLTLAVVLSACGSTVENDKTEASPAASLPEAPPVLRSAQQPIPNLQAELIDARNKTTTSPIGSFDFKNYTYELPRGWQNPDGTAEIELINGRIAPIEKDVNDSMDDEESASAKTGRRIGLSYVTTKYLDLTSDGQDEAIVVLKVETGGSAVPQLVYIFDWKDDKPALIWPFRTGDRADGGLKDIRTENDEVVVELYGQD